MRGLDLERAVQQECERLSLRFPCAVAVSGGSDSMALLHFLKTISNKIIAVTVDHCLRPESSDEACHVGKWCEAIGIQHHILTWKTDDKPDSNIQDQARTARYNLLNDFCHKHHLNDICVGHTLNDQAETVLMRLMRGSGVDGLCAMQPTRQLTNTRIVRPLLSIDKKDLQNYLHVRNQNWIEDPSNQDDRYTRIAVRKTLDNLSIPLKKMTNTAQRMQMAQAVLQDQCSQLAARCVTKRPAGVYAVDRAIYFNAYPETQLRLLASLLQIASGNIYRPRWSALNTLQNNILMRRSSGVTLHGCMIRLRQKEFLIFREPQLCEPPLTLQPDQTLAWDNRYRITNTTSEVVNVGSVQTCPHPIGWPKNTPAAAQSSCLCIWSDERLYSVPEAEINHTQISVTDIDNCTKMLMFKPTSH